MKGAQRWFRGCYRPRNHRRPCCFLSRSAKWKPAGTPYQHSRRWESSSSLKSRKYQERPKSGLKITYHRIQVWTQSLSGFSLWIAEIDKCTRLWCLAIAFVLKRLQVVFFFPSSGLDVLEYDLNLVRLILDHCVLDCVICQDVLFKEKQVLRTASHIRVQQPNSQLTHWFCISWRVQKIDTSHFYAQFEVSALLALHLTGFQWSGCRWHLCEGIGRDGWFPLEGALGRGSCRCFVCDHLKLLGFYCS